jgi:hypothetical protein
MATVSTYNGFRDTLASLSLSQQRQVASRFIANVLDLAHDPRLAQIVEVAAKADVTAEELQVAYRTAHSVYVETHPRSGFAELDFDRQAGHFVAEACVTCLGPMYQEATTHHLAQNVAMYCRMARTCSSIAHKADKPDFSSVELAAEAIMKDQYAILNEFTKK